MQSIPIIWRMQAVESVITTRTTKPANSFISRVKNSAAVNVTTPKKRTIYPRYGKLFTAAVPFAIETCLRPLNAKSGRLPVAAVI